MKRKHPLANYMQSYFYQYLVSIRGLSTNTVLAYRDTLKSLICFTAKHLKKSADQLAVEDLNDAVILVFLKHLENCKGNSVRTRNARLAGIRAFFRFIGSEEPTLLQQCRRIRSIPIKRTKHKTIDYLDNNEVKAIFDSINLQSRMGTRDKALLLFLYNTGARAQEIVDLKISDLRLDSPGQVTIFGKGRKERTCPLWPETVNAIKTYLEHRRLKSENNHHLFLNAHHKQLTRFGVRYITRHYVQIAAEKCASLKRKSVGPHTFRHSTAMLLIQAGNDINMVKLWLGHADLNTTHIYVEIDMEMKRRILNSSEPPISDSKRARPKKWQKPKILKWLDELENGSQMGCV